MTLDVLRAAALSLFCALPLQALAADIGPANRWLEWKNNFSVMAEGMKACDVTPALATQWDQSLQQMARRLAKTSPAMPDGLWGDLSGYYESPEGDPSCKTAPMTGSLRFAVWVTARLEKKPGQSRLTRPGPSGEGGGSAAAVYLYLNQLRGTGEVDYLNDGGSPRMTAAAPPTTLLGFALWEERWLHVLAPGHAPPFVPATLERVVKAWLKKQNAEMGQMANGRKEAEAAKQKPMADMYAKMIEANRPRIENVRKLLDLPAAQLKGPVFVGGRAEVQAQPEEGTQQVWLDNPGFFDPTLPRSAVQLAVIDIYGMNIDQPADAKADAKAVVRQFVERTDWKALAKDGFK